MPANSGSACEVLVVEDTWTEKQVAQYVSRLVGRSLYTDRTFILLNVRDLIEKVKIWKKEFPRVTPFYAVKCNYSPVVLEVLAALGLSFDCASMHEIDIILRTGVKPHRILYAHTAKPQAHIIHAKQNGIDLFTFDSDIELFKMKQYHPRAKLIIRIKSDASVALYSMGNKFGCCTNREAPMLLQFAKELNLQVVGVSFHVGSMCGEIEAFRRGIEMARKLFNIGRSLGHQMKILDIGGGFRGESKFSITKIAKYINSALDEYFPEDEDVEIISEPGRYFVTSAFTLACCVHSAKRRPSVVEEGCIENIEQGHEIKDNVQEKNNSYVQDNCYNNGSSSQDLKENNGTGNGERIDSKKEERNCGLKTEEAKIMYYMDNGVWSSFATLASEAIKADPEPLEELPGPLIPCSLWGPTCDATDLISPLLHLPALPLPSWLLFSCYGAYTSTTCSFFNGFGQPSEYAYATKSTWELLRKLPHIQEVSSLTQVSIESDLPQPFLHNRPIPTNLSFKNLYSCNSNTFNGKGIRHSGQDDANSPLLTTKGIHHSVQDDASSPLLTTKDDIYKNINLSNKSDFVKNGDTKLDLLQNIRNNAELFQINVSIIK